MKQLKRLTSVLLVLGMVLGLMPLSAFAAEPAYTAENTFTVDDGEYTYTYTYTLDKGDAKLTHFDTTAQEANVEIPSEIPSTTGKGYPVTSIGDKAFYKCAKLTAVNLGNSVETIGESAFGECTQLKTVNLGNSVVSIGDSAFGDCSQLETVNFPNSITSIGNGAFAGCTRLETVDLGNSVKSIGVNAFMSCTNMKKLTIPKSIEEIKAGAFFDGAAPNKIKKLYYTGTKAQWDELVKKYNNTFSITGFYSDNNMLHEPECAHTVSFDYCDPAKETSQVVQKEVQYEGTVTPPTAPTADHYQFEGWYTQKTDGTKFDFGQKITEDVILYAHWSKVEATYPDLDMDKGYTLTDIEHTLTAKDGSLVRVTVEQNGKTVDITENVELEQQGTTQIRKIPAGAMVTVAANAAPEGMVFAQWNISDPELMGDPAVAYTSQTMKFPMPAADVTICARWSMVEANPDPDPDKEYTLTDEGYTLTDKDGSLVCVTAVENGKTVDITKSVVLNKQGTTQIGKIPAGAMVTVAANAAPEGMVFAQWNISDPALMGDPDVAHTSQTMTFPMPEADVTVEAMYESAENARETELLGSAAMIGAVGISAVVLAYQAHQLGTELYLRYLLPSGAAIPQNRIQLAELLWRNAGEPVPDVNAMYEDIGLNDDAAQQAAQWALENELMELPDEEHTEQFKPDEQISYGEAIRAWKKAQQLKTAE